MPAKYSVQGMGWLPDFPDFRDRTPADPHVEPLLTALDDRAAGGPARVGRSELVVLSRRGPGPDRVVHGERGGRSVRVLRAACQR